MSIYIFHKYLEKHYTTHTTCELPPSLVLNNVGFCTSQFNSKG